jgi:hypothetical protein
MWEEVMHAVIRNYSGKGAKELFDVIEKNKAEVEKVIRPVKGFVSYAIARTADGGFSVTVCQDKAGCDESVLRHAIGLRRMRAILAPLHRPSRKAPSCCI